MIELLLYFTAGLIQEIFVTSWHRAIAYKWKLTAAILTALISAVSLLVISGILVTITASHGWITYAYVASFCLGKGCGAYASLSFWDAKFGDLDE